VDKDFEQYHLKWFKTAVNEVLKELHIQ